MKWSVCVYRLTAIVRAHTQNKSKKKTNNKDKLVIGVIDLHETMLKMVQIPNHNIKSNRCELTLRSFIQHE